MNREEKADLLSELNELFNGAEVIVVSHYKGLTVKEVSELRNNVRKAGAGFRVTKNRITRLALKGTKFESLADLFKGPTAIAFANDPISACKACVEFAKTNEKLIKYCKENNVTRTEVVREGIKKVIEKNNQENI